MSSLFSKTLLPIVAQINKQHLARINACGISLFQLYEKPNLADYIRNKCIYPLHEEPEVKNAEISEEEQSSPNTIHDDIGLKIEEKGVYKNVQKRYNISDKNTDNPTRKNFEANQELKEQFALYKDYLKDYAEDEQEEVFEELYATAELLVNEYLRVKANYPHSISETNYLEALLNEKSDKLPKEKLKKSAAKGNNE